MYSDNNNNNKYLGECNILIPLHNYERHSSEKILEFGPSGILFNVHTPKS